MLKKISTLVICTTFALSLFGCSPIILQTTQGKDGNVSSALTFNATTLSSPQKEIIYDFTEEYSTQLIDAYKANLISLFSHLYDFESLNIFAETDKLNHIFLHNDNFKLLAGKIDFSLSRQQFLSNEESSLTLSIGFTSVYAYMMFFCPIAFSFDTTSHSIKFNSDTYQMLIDVPIIPTDFELSENAFMTTYLQTCLPFSYNGAEPTLLEDYKTFPAGTTLISAIQTELEESGEDAQFIFQFFTPFARLHSNGTTQSVQNGVVHSWSLGSDILGEVLLWRNYSNHTLWYVIAIGAGVFTLTIGFLIIHFTKKAKKQTTTTQLEPSNKDSNET